MLKNILILKKKAIILVQWKMYRLNLKDSGYVLSPQFVHLFIEKFWTPGRVEAKPVNPVHIISTFGNKNDDSTFLAKSMPSPPVIFQLTI